MVKIQERKTEVWSEREISSWQRQRRAGQEEWGEGRMIAHQTEKIPGSKRGHLWDGWNGRPKVRGRKSLKAKKGVEVLYKMSVVFKTCTYPHPQTGVCA